jgi:hypothetical protein
MPRIEPLDPAQATGRSRELLDEVAGRGGQPGPMVRAMANAPALLRAYLDPGRRHRRNDISEECRVNTTYRSNG